MKVRTQFIISILAFGIVAIILVSSFIVTNNNLSQLSKEQTLSKSIEINIDILDYTSTGIFLHQENLTRWQSIVSLLRSDISKLNSSNLQQQTRVGRINLDLEKADSLFKNEISEMRGAPLNQSLKGYTVIWNMTAQIHQLTFDARDLSRVLDKQAADANRTSLILIASLIGLFAGYFILIYLLVFKRTLKSINNLKEKTKKISRGNFNVPAHKYSKDEIGELSADFDEMTANLNRTTTSKQRLEEEISERKKAEQALMEAQGKLKEYASNLEKIVDERTKKIQESEQSYRELYESFGEAFIATDWEFNIRHWNKAAERVTTIEAKYALGRKVYDVLPEMASVDITPYFEALQQNKNARFMMNAVSRETGQEAVFEISTYPSTSGIIIIVEDKTEEERTKRLSAIGQTAGMVGHDIRNPLQAITSDLYLIREELTGNPECMERKAVQESLSSIEENIFYIDKIVSDLQDFTRPLAPQAKELNLKKLLLSVLTTIKIPKNIETALDAQEDLVVITDAAFLKRILSNLIINALQAMPNTGKLMLNAQKKENNVLIKIKDTGVGIPKESKDKIFTPLFTTKAKGQGLGLAVVKRLVNELKGNITYESEEGRGTEFIVELPLSN